VNERTVEYINKCVNVTQDEFILGREKMGNSEIIIVGVPGCVDPLYTLIDFKKEKSKYRIEQSGEEIARIERVTPKGTGGEPAFAMLILSSISKHDLSIDASGLLMKFILNNLEWNTGRLIRKRDKKTLTKQMISEQYSIGKIRLKNILSELKGIVEYRPRFKAYYVNHNAVRKGMVK
jgi:hypothetical protein